MIDPALAHKRHEMREELRRLLWHQAQLIRVMKDIDAASAFLGFEMDDCLAPEVLQLQIDLDQFNVGRLMEAAFPFAFQPSDLTRMDDQEVDELKSAMEGLLHLPPVWGDETPASELCRTIVDTCFARCMIEPDDWGQEAEEHQFTIRELALLADMTEGAVRNALADRSENGLRAIPGSKPVKVAPEEARRWLAGRRGYVRIPGKALSPGKALENPFARQVLQEADSARALGDLIIRRMQSGFAPAALAESLGCTAEEIEAWRQGSFRFDADQAARLAEQLGFDVPLFVGKALEVSLRRDATLAQGALP